MRENRLQLNPQPLKLVKRRELATVREMADSVRCHATTKRGYRCTRIQAAASEYCSQHRLALEEHCV